VTRWFLPNIWTVPSLSMRNRNTSRKLHSRIQYARNSRVPNGKPSRLITAIFFRRCTRQEHDEEDRTKEDVSCVEIQWIEYSIFSALGRPEDRRWLARSPARPEDPTKAAYWPSVTSIGFLSDISAPSV